MTTFDLLDRIADSVNPTLGVLALSLPWLRRFRLEPPSAWRRVAGTLLCVALAYAGQAFDQLTGVWMAFSLDYSTHSAVCVALLISLAHLGRRWAMASMAIGASYIGLMMYQGYHTFADILTTAVPIGVACEAGWRLLLLRSRTSCH